MPPDLPQDEIITTVVLEEVSSRFMEEADVIEKRKESSLRILLVWVQSLS